MNRGHLLFFHVFLYLSTDKNLNTCHSNELCESIRMTYVSIFIKKNKICLIFSPSLKPFYSVNLALKYEVNITTKPTTLKIKQVIIKTKNKTHQEILILP